MQLAIEHENHFTALYNDSVVASMNKIVALFPDNSKLLQELEAQQEGYLKLLKSQSDDLDKRSEIKACIE